MQADRVVTLTQVAIEIFKVINARQHPLALMQDKAEDMHFIAHMLLELVEIAYPLEKEPELLPYWEAYRNFVNFLIEDNHPRIKIPSYEEWLQWLKMAGVE